MPGRKVSIAECEELWDAWTPSEVAQRLSNVTAPWCVAAGWALELFSDRAARVHSDLEIAVPSSQFDQIVAAFSGFEWDVAGNGRIWPLPEGMADHFQTWLRQPATGRYRVDVFREPHVGSRWVCRRGTSITLPYEDLILRTDDGIPYVIPEVVLLFKAKHLRSKDQADFHQVLPVLDAERRERLCNWLSLVHPGHPWIECMETVAVRPHHERPFPCTRRI
ncbi:hypothetical protein [Antrihabitans cavernicola]|uniref:Amino acid transporter n=1 Tax=Antrihabitans cavernicola TaxID=2495913 RepID=A0A5A7S7E5_9NOCA|nr:hypothetical protein [Spelaeibacter cavernicola]KAA0021062.1 hypothetical protein FOY51_20785 [Spelaeibacter cavernicola]